MAQNASLKFESKTGKYALFCGKNALIPKMWNNLHHRSARMWLQGPHLVAGMLKSGGNAKNSKGQSSAFYVGAWISEYRCQLQGPNLVWWECFSSDDSTARGFKLPNWETGCSTDAVWDWISGRSKGIRIYILIVIVFLCLYLYSYL